MRLRRRHRTKKRSVGAGAALLVVTLGVATACGNADGEPSGLDAFGHVHAIAVDPADGHLYLATHHGVFQLADAGPARRMGEGRQDTMGFAIAGPSQFLASGHPAPGEGGPVHLGLIESTDAGRTWRTLSLAGQADFHALRVAPGVVYGLNSTDGALMASADRVTWQVRSSIELHDLAVDPARPETVLAATEQGVRRSVDGGRTWSPPSGPPLRLLHWSTPGQLWAVASDGRLLRSADGGVAWTATGGRVPDTPAAFTVDGDTIHLATADGRVRRSSDAGATWQAR